MKEYVLTNLPELRGAAAFRSTLMELRKMCAVFREDGQISDLEAAALEKWMGQHHMEMAALGLGGIVNRLGSILEDKVITTDERAEMLPMVDAIIEACGEGERASGSRESGGGLLIFDEPEELIPDGSKAVVTGTFLYAARKAVEKEVVEKGWSLDGKVSRSCGLVLVGSVPSPKWSRGVFGNKIAEVLRRREEGDSPPLLISEGHWRKLRETL